MITTAAAGTDSPLKAIYFLITGVSLFSFQDVIIKWMSGDYPVHEIVLIRSLFAIVPMLGIAYLEGGLHLLRTRRLGTHILRALVMFGAYTCFYLSLARLPLAETVSLFFSSPIFIMILSVISLGEKVALKSWIAALTGFLGVVVMLKPGAQAMDPAAFLAVLTAVLYAIASIITRKLGRTESGVSLAFYVMVMYIIFGAIIGLVLNNIEVGSHSHPSYLFLVQKWRWPSQADLLIFIVLGLIAATGFYSLSQAYRLAQPSTIAPFEYTAVPLSVLWGYLFWQDVLGVQSVVGMLLIVGSGLYIFGSRRILTNKYILSIFKVRIRR